MRRSQKPYAASIISSLGVAGFLYLFLGQIPRTAAIPAFSRKYQTSCSTCHNDYPELNDFGLAFKKNGFKFPKDDELFVKEPPVMLGAKAQKQVFPKAIYPGEIPGAIPIAFRYSGFATYNSKQPLALGFVPRTDLFAPNTFTIISAGAFGPTISWWIDDDISAGGSGANGGLGDGYLKVNDLGHYIGLPKDALNLRIGQFEMDLPFTQARTINPTDYDIYDEAAIIPPTLVGTTNNPLVFGAPQRGIELGGYPNDGNFWWSVALLNGSNDSTATRNTKDVFVNVWKQFNLERDPKARSEIQAAGPTGPRDHTSLRVGGFYYYGRNALNMGGTLFEGLPSIHEPFYRTGADFRFKYRNFELFGLGMFGHDANLLVNATGTGFVPGSPVNFSGGFGQAEYWIYPWLIGIMRYDVVNSPLDFRSGLSEHFTRNRFSPGLQILVRANIKTVFEYQRRWQQPIPETAQFFRANGFVAGVDFAF